MMAVEWDFTVWSINEHAIKISQIDRIEPDYTPEHDLKWIGLTNRLV